MGERMNNKENFDRAEKRKQKRYPSDIKLTVESLYKQDYVEIENVNEDIELTDISRSGIGFSCTQEFPIGYYFNARIVFDEKRYFYSVIKLLRSEKTDGRYHYGCEFVGLADVLSIMVEDYGKEV